MAAPITHIVLAEKVYEKYFSDKGKREFFVGTSLPDIRYLGVVDRDKTHFKNVSLRNCRALNSFSAGLMFHSLVDEVRENFMRKNNYYSFFKKSELLTQASKVFEDRVLYNKLDSWPEVISYFDEPLKGELDQGIKKIDVARWHQLLKKYFAREPKDEDTITFTLGMGFPLERAKEIINVINDADNDKARKAVLDLYNTFEKLI